MWQLVIALLCIDIDRHCHQRDIEVVLMTCTFYYSIQGILSTTLDENFYKK